MRDTFLSPGPIINSKGAVPAVLAYIAACEWHTVPTCTFGSQADNTPYTAFAALFIILDFAQ